MRIEQPQRRDQPWLVYAQPGEFYGNTEDVLLGTVSPRGALQVVKRRFRGDRLQSARLRLDDARRTLVSGGHIRDRALERAIEEEARTGSFIVELDNGEERRFHVFAPGPAAGPGRRTTAPRYDRPSAREWAEEALQSGRATHADLFRSSAVSPEDPRRPTIFTPRILPARGEHDLLVVGEAEQLPFHSMTMRAGGLRLDRPREVQRAYEVKKHAMNLVTQRTLGLGSQWTLPGVGELRPFASEIADAWEVAADAFEEAGLPLQVVFSRDNARYWRDEARSGRRYPAPVRSER